MPQHFSRMVVPVGLMVAALTGCHLEVDAQRDTAEDGVTGEVSSAVVTTYYDFIANAPGAAWHNNDGGLPWKTDDTRGACFTSTGNLETGVPSTYLYAEPKNVAQGFMHASYTVTIPPASAHPTVTATFGLVQGASATSGLTFSLTTRVNGSWVTLFSQTKSYTGALVTKTADLSVYAGQTIQLFLNVDAGYTAISDWGAWTDVRLVVDGATGPVANGCTIGGVTYPNAAVNPATSCLVCDPSSNATDWSIRADSCRIGGLCYGADERDPLGCKRCDPLTSQTTWTNKTACDKLVVAASTTTSDGVWSNLSVPHLYPDQVCAANGQALGLPGTWQAMYSDGNVRNYKDTVPTQHASKPVVNLQGQQLYTSWDSIFVDQTWPAGVSMYAFNGAVSNSQVWTGTSLTGEALSSGTCLKWTKENDLGSTGNLQQRKIIDGGQKESCRMGTAAFACVLVPPEPPIIVENYDGTPLGALKGKGHGDSVAYLGVPYAAPPTGSLRLAPPAKATAWSGVRNAFSQPPPCAQPPLLPLGGMIGSEDCLYLNVWAPKAATPTSGLPVIVFQHGGGSMFGGTAASADWLATGFLDGDRFAAAQNAVFVTIQSRLGALGYLTATALATNSSSRTSSVGGGTSGNYGLLDAIQALKWVKRNIAKFGGDPTKVAFAGQSSGASIVCDLLSSPLAKDPADSNKPYFSSVIMDSGFCEAPSVAFRQSQGTPAIASIGCGSASDKVACLRSASVQSFVSTAGDVLGFFPDLFGRALPPELVFGLTWGPHIDGYVLPQQPRVSFAAGTHNKVPTIVGTNKEEGTFFMLFMVGGILTGDLPNMIVLDNCGTRDTKVNLNLGTTLANAATALYPCYPLDILSPTRTYAQALTHLQWECPARRTARALDIGQTQPVRRYWFTHWADHLGILQNLFGLIRDIGASHTFELPYVFNTHNTVLGYWPSTRERDLGTAMQKYWRNFANSGDPNYSGGVNWTAYDRTLDNTAKLEVAGSPGGIQMVNGVSTEKCDFWDNNFSLDGWK